MVYSLIPSSHLCCHYCYFRLLAMHVSLFVYLSPTQLLYLLLLSVLCTAWKICMLLDLFLQSFMWSKSFMECIAMKYNFCNVWLWLRRDNPDCEKMDAVDRGEGHNSTCCSPDWLHHCLGRSLRLLLCFQPRVSGGSQHNIGVCSEVLTISNSWL